MARKHARRIAMGLVAAAWAVDSARANPPRGAEPAPQPPRVHVSVAAPASRRADDDGRARAKLLGALTFTRVTVTFDQTPMRDAVAALKDALGVPIIGRWSDAATAAAAANGIDGLGIDPSAPISLEAVDKPALEVLEEMLEQCAFFDECTWQLRRGFIELGTKRRLSVPAARETRTYLIRDLMLEPPEFARKRIDDDNPEMAYSSAALGAALRSVGDGGESVKRKSPRELARGRNDAGSGTTSG